MTVDIASFNTNLADVLWVKQLPAQIRVPQKKVGQQAQRANDEYHVAVRQHRHEGTVEGARRRQCSDVLLHLAGLPAQVDQQTNTCSAKLGGNAVLDKDG